MLRLMKKPMNKITITALEPQKNRAGRRSVYGNGTFLFGIDEETCIKTGLCTGKTLSPEELEQVRLASEYADAKNAAFRLVARKSYTRFLLSKKLREKGYGNEAVTSVVELMEELGYVDDQDYAKRLIHDSIHLKKKGKRLVLQELCAKGISRQMAEALWEEQEVPEELLAQLIEKKLTDPSDPKCVKRTFDYCVRRGHSYSEVTQAMSAYLQTE